MGTVLYVLADPDGHTASVTVSDDVALPVASIETAYAQVLPGGSVLATVTVEPAPSSPISVGITADDNDGTGGYQVYQGGSVVTSVSVGTSGSAEIRVSASHITGGQLSSAGGTVSSLEVDLDTSSDYTIDPAKDDLSVSFAAVPGTLAGLTIAGPASAVDEGTTATFSVTADPAPSVDVTVAVQVYDAANRLDYVDDATLYFRLAANATSLSVPVATKKVTGDGLDGVVLALLQNGAGYTHSGTGYADVHDTDGATPSTITVSADPASVVEGGVITFTMTVVVVIVLGR